MVWTCGTHIRVFTAAKLHYQSTLLFRATQRNTGSSWGDRSALVKTRSDAEVRKQSYLCTYVAWKHVFLLGPFSAIRYGVC